MGGDLVGPKDDLHRRESEIVKLLKSDKDGRVLDFGCGKGELVRSLRAQGFTAFGFDPDRESISTELVDTLVFSELDSVPNEKFKVVTLFHVIEHIYQIHEFLVSLRRFISSEGRLIIETPNANDALLKKYKSVGFSNFTYWSHHPNLCTNDYLVEALEDAGYEVEVNGQIMRYDLANHMHWLAEGKPGGHEKWKAEFSEATSHHYSADLQSKGQADTIWIVARPGGFAWRPNF